MREILLLKSVFAHFNCSSVPVDLAEHLLAPKLIKLPRPPRLVVTSGCLMFSLFSPLVGDCWPSERVSGTCGEQLASVSGGIVMREE